MSNLYSENIDIPNDTYFTITGFGIVSMSVFRPYLEIKTQTSLIVAVTDAAGVYVSQMRSVATYLGTPHIPQPLAACMPLWTVPIKASLSHATLIPSQVLDKK